MPILSDDPTSTPRDKLAILQDSDEWSAIPGFPGPATPAMDEIYYDQIAGLNCFAYAFGLTDAHARNADARFISREVGDAVRC